MSSCRSFLITAVSLFALSACVTGPMNDTIVSPFTPIPFTGYASLAGSGVAVEALDRRTNVWVIVGTATAASSVTSVNGDDLYFWETDVVFAQSADWECFWSAAPSCTIPTGSAFAQVRVRQGDETLMMTFDEGYGACITSRLDEGGGGYAAGFECRSDAAPILTLNWIT